MSGRRDLHGPRTGAYAARSLGRAGRVGSVSGDGASIFGFELITETTPNSLARVRRRFFRWTANAGHELFAPTSGVAPGTIDFVSHDGNTMWGRYETVQQGLNMSLDFIWTAQAGYVESRHLVGWPSDGLSSLTGSQDGRVILGYLGDDKGFLWSKDSGRIDIPPLPGSTRCPPRVLSADGSTVFGACYEAPPSMWGETSPPVGYRWTAAGGTVPIADSPGASIQISSVDGGVGVAVDADNRTLLRWTKTHGLVRLTVPDELFVTGGRVHLGEVITNPTANGIAWSGDTLYGRVSGSKPPVGGSTAPLTEKIDRPFRWSETDGFVRLDHPHGGDESYVFRTTPDGSLAVGTSRLVGQKGSDAVIWDSRGVRVISDVLIAAGINLDGANLTDANRVWLKSESMAMIVGSARIDGQSRAWIAWLPLRP